MKKIHLALTFILGMAQYALCQTPSRSNIDTVALKLIIGAYVFADPSSHFMENGTLKTLGMTDGLPDYIQKMECFFLGREPASGFLFIEVKNVATAHCFTVAIQPHSGWLYRLKGFYLLDLMAFFQNLKAKKALKDFLSGNHGIRGIDFQCLYRVSKRQKMDSIKYPCLLYNPPCVNSAAYDFLIIR